MSYPLHRPTGKLSRTVRTAEGFWGFDPNATTPERSRETYNLIWEGNALKLREGYTSVAALSGKVNGIFPYGDMLIVHSGTGLWKVAGGVATPLDATLNDAPSVGAVRHQSVVRRTCLDADTCRWQRETVEGDFLFLNDGAHYYFFDGTALRTVCDPDWGALSAEGYYATVPYTVVGRTPTDGGGDVDPRGDNRLTQFRCESFCVEEGENVMLLRLSVSASRVNRNIPPEVRVRDEEGVWHCVSTSAVGYGLSAYTGQVVTIMALQAGMGLNIDQEGYVSGGTGTVKMANDGLDNLQVTFAVYKQRPYALERATVQGFYGADGADNVLFLGGSVTAPGTDAFSAPDDLFCFYATSTEQLGDPATPVTGYLRLNDGRLAVLKNDPDNAAVFFRSYLKVQVGNTTVEAYPSRAGAPLDGCLNPRSCAYAGNEPLFLAGSGLYAVRSVSDELTNLNETVKRSADLDGILDLYDPADARAIRWGGYYLLCFGKDAFITDGATERGALRFLPWRFSHRITALAQREGDLYLGDENGNLYRYGGTADGEIPLKGRWTSVLEHENGRKVLLHRHWVLVTPAYGGSLTAVLGTDCRDHPPCTYSLDLLDLGAVDFGRFTFEGCPHSRWLAVDPFPLSGERVVLRLSPSAGVKLRGIRASYGKGGIL